MRVVDARHPGADFARARLVDVELVRCDLSGCDFSESVLAARPAGRLPGLRARDPAGEPARRLVPRLQARQRELPAGRLFCGSGSTTRCSRASSSTGGSLDDVGFHGSDLTGADFSNVRCKTVDLRGRPARRAARHRRARRRDDRLRAASGPGPLARAGARPADPGGRRGADAPESRPAPGNPVDETSIVTATIVVLRHGPMSSRGGQIPTELTGLNRGRHRSG